MSEFALRNARLLSLLVALLATAGLVSYLNFPSKEDPEVTIREAVVVAVFPGMSPERVENLLTRKIEKKIRLIPEVKRISASSKTGMSILHVVVYDRFFEMEPIWQDLRNKMNELRPELPEGTQGPYVDADFGDVFVASIALVGHGFEMAEMREAARNIRDELYTVDGVKKVILHGIQPERVFLDVDNARLAQYGIPPETLAETLANQNVILPGGSVDTGLVEVVIEPTGNFTSVADIENVVLRVPATNEVAYLKDLVRVERAYIDPPQRKAYFNGDPAIVIAVSMMKGGNVLEFSPRLRAKIDELEASLPVGFELDFATYQASYVAEAVQGVAINVYETLGIVLAVVMLFLGIRTGLIVGTVIPLTILLTFIVMRMLGIELQRVSLATLIIALGLLVDNGIVMAEEIGSRLASGEARRDACINAGKSLGVPLLTSSLTTILAFVPLALAPDSSGEYMRSMSQVLTITLMVSWGLAITVTPLMCFWWMKTPDITPEQAKARFEAPLFRRYRQLVFNALRLRTVFLAAVVGCLIGAFYLATFIPQQFMPNSSRNQFLVYLDLPAGYGSKATDRELQKLLSWLNDRDTNPEIEQHVAYMGYGGPRFFVPLSPRDEDPNLAFVLVTTDSSDSVAPLIERTRKHLAAHHPDVAGRLKQFWLGTSETGLVEVRIRGRDAETLYALGEEVAAKLAAIPGTVDVHNDWQNRINKVVVDVDQARARRAGFSSREVADSLSGFFSGTTVTNYREGDKVIPVVLRGEHIERNNLGGLRTLGVYSSTASRTAPLLQLADFDSVSQFSRIERRNLERTITISAKHAWLQAADVEAALMPELQSLEAKMPAGFEWEFGGETADADKSTRALGTYVPHALAAMVLLMVWQFNSFAKPAIIFITIPMTFIGAIVGLWASGAFMGFMAILGFLSLAGIIINNAIVLLETIQTEIDAGAAPFDAVMNASVSRFQPVMMTTCTTILGLFTLMIPPSPLFFAMAVVIAAGIALGTLLTLLAVPALYTLFFRVEIPNVDAGAPAGSVA